MSEANKTETGFTTYEIKTVEDFFKVPAARRLDCLKEFLTYMMFIDTALATGQALGAPFTHNYVFNWTDDGICNGTVVFQDGVSGAKTEFRIPTENMEL